ncbi:MAG TPA: hypothetical protein PLV68_02540, partial [Ilumatobacteraceae bacterium]|nr:hypothetical protein [Ilumatobacteraceae bacterium]
AGHDPITVTLPDARWGDGWRTVVCTASGAIDTPDAPVQPPGATLDLDSFSLLLMEVVPDESTMETAD